MFGQGIYGCEKPEVKRGVASPVDFLAKHSNGVENYTEECYYANDRWIFGVSMNLSERDSI